MVRVVGGAVRNTLMGLPLSDIDFASTATPDQVVTLAQAAGIKYLPTGLQHGTVTLIIDSVPFEITTLRRDEQTDGRHAVVAFTRDWEGDAARRDFSVNALYCNADGSLFDPLGGMVDLEDRRIVFIGDADARIAEDYLRIFRFFRFYAQYGEGDIDTAGFQACIRGREGLRQISAERIHSELFKLLVAPKAKEAVSALYASGVLVTVFNLVPCLSRFGTMLRLENILGQQPDPVVRLAALFVQTPETIAQLDKRLKLSRQQKRQLAWFSEGGRRAFIRETGLDYWLYFKGKDAVRNIMCRSVLDCFSKNDEALYLHIFSIIEQWHRPSFPVTGQDLIAWGYVPGRELGRVLGVLEHEWVKAGFVQTREDLKQKISGII